MPFGLLKKAQSAMLYDELKADSQPVSQAIV